MAAAVLQDNKDPGDLLAGNSRRRIREGLLKAGVAAAALMSIVISLAIVGSLVYRAGEFLFGLASPNDVDLEEARDGISFANLWGDQWAPRFFEFDIKTLLVGSVIVTVIAIVPMVVLA